MAITILQAPGSFTAGTPYSGHSMHAPVWHVVSSTNAALPGFRYIFDITTDGYFPGGAFGFGPITVRMLVVPDANFQGIIDISRIVRSFRMGYFDPRGTAQAPYAIKTDGLICTYAMRYGEEFGGTQYPALEEDAHFLFNTYIGETPGTSLDTPAAPYFKSWATNQDTGNILIPATGSTFLSYFNVPNGDSLKMRVNLTGAGGIIGPDHDTTASVIPEHLLVLNLNHNYINAAYGSPVLAASSDYRVALFTSGGTQRTAWAYVLRMCEPKTPVTTLHFLNRIGGFDTYHFTGPTRKGVALERKTFEQIPAISSGGMVREYNSVNKVFADTVIPFNSRHTWTRRLVSGHLNDATHEWLWQLVASPEVYLEEDGYFYPVRIKTDNWAQRLARFDKMYNLELEIIMGRQVLSQSR